MKLSWYLYRVIKTVVKFVYRKIEIVGTEKLPDEPCIIVANHSQMHGPITAELYFPEKRYIWCTGEMMNFKEVPAYAFKDFWSKKPKYIRWFYRILSYLIAPLSVIIFNNASTIAVYRDRRIISTLKTSVEKLIGGANIIIFPENTEKLNNVINDFNDGFVDLARFYYKKTGRELKFVPVYLAPNLKKMFIGNAISYDMSSTVSDEKLRICNYLKKEITGIAYSLPRHIVVPFDNVLKKEYPYNIEEVKTDESENV